MRTRSSQFVFLLLLLCSVQLREEYTLHLAAGAMAGHAHYAAQRVEKSAAHPSLAEDRQAVRKTPAQEPSSTVATVWAMPRPSLDAAAVASHTSFLRA